MTGNAATVSSVCSTPAWRSARFVQVLQIGYSDQVFELKIDNETIFRDDLTGQILDPTLVKAERKKELDFFESKGV